MLGKGGFSGYRTRLVLMPLRNAWDGAGWDGALNRVTGLICFFWRLL